MKQYILLIICFSVFFASKAQTIAYSEPDKDDGRGLQFEIVGKMNNQYLIYKNVRSSYKLSLYDNDMKMTGEEKFDFLPDKVINSDILAYKNFFYFFYQYQKRNIVYCMAAKIDGNGKLMQDPVQLDTTQINFLANNKVYSYIVSEDKQKIGFVKINTKNEDNFLVTTLVFDNNLALLNRTVAYVDMHEHNDFLTEFNIDNDGDIVYLRAVSSAQKDNISKVTLISKSASKSDVTLTDLTIPEIFLDDIRLKIDNANKNYLICSFYSKNKRGNVDGLYASLYSKSRDSILGTSQTTFSEDLRNNAKSEGNARYAFNDFFLQNIVMRKDGGYLIAAESVYSTSRGDQYNRWDYFNSYGNPYMPLNSYYYSYGNPYGYYYPWNRGGSGFQNTRYFADNVALLSFDSTANLSWSNIIHKSQYDDNTDDFIGYITMNTGSEMHFLYNETVRKNILPSDQSITPDGKVNHIPTLRNLDRGYHFMPRMGKQVGAKQMIIPCSYRNYICFAKVDF